MDEARCLTGADILNANDTKIEQVDLPELDGFVYVKTMTGAEKDAFDSSLLVTSGGHREVVPLNARAKFLVHVICDADGQKLFTEADIERLGQKSSAVLDRLWKAARRLAAAEE
ncbi:MAG: hypothetical protein JSS26_08355 [Nitrospira sp.]|nr:hypothetical protein [Nitrospira sp.]